MKDKKKNIICAVVAVAIVVVCIIAGVFIVKRNADENTDVENSTTTTTTTTTTTEETSTTTEIPTSGTTEKDISVTVVDGIVSNTDRNNFIDMLGHLLWFNFDAENVSYDTLKENELHNFRPYDYKTSAAKRYAYSSLMTGYCTLLEEIGAVYNWEDFNIYECWKNAEDDPEFEQDPQKILGDYYCWVEEKYVDMALKTVFNVQPDHNYVLKSKNGEVYAYYHDGYYYYRGDDGGDGAGPDIVINDIKVMDDGKYSIDATYYILWGDEREKIFDLNVIAEMKTVESNSIWSFYKIDKV